MPPTIDELKNRYHAAHDAAIAAAETGRPRQDLTDAAHDAYEELHRARALEAGFPDVNDYDQWLALNAKRTIELARRLDQINP